VDFKKAVPEHICKLLPAQSQAQAYLASDSMSTSEAKAYTSMQDVVRLGYGDAAFVTPDNILEAAKRAIDGGYTRYEYLPELRVAIAERLLRDNGIEADPQTEIIVSCGCHAIIFQIFATFIEPGDEVILGTPGKYYYDNTVFQGGTPVEVQLRESRRFRIDPDEIAEAITPRTKFIALTTPDAPTGAVHLRDDLEKVAELAQEHDLLVISDEIYDKIIFGETPHFSIASLPGMRERTLTVNGFSKVYAMTGWRVGYAVVPAHLISALKMVNSLNTIWLNTIAQYAALEAYRGPQESVDGMVAEYRRRMAILVEGINAIEGMRMLFPDGTYYGWPDISSYGLSSEEFTKHVLHSEQIMVNPGTSFGKGGEGHIRISCSQPEAEMLEGIRRLRLSIQHLVEKGPVLIPPE
jgi:aspartate/methionine/tyrosine aminotransferase